MSIAEWSLYNFYYRRFPNAKTFENHTQKKTSKNMKRSKPLQVAKLNIIYNKVVGQMTTNFIQVCRANFTNVRSFYVELECCQLLKIFKAFIYVIHGIMAF